MFTDHGAVLYIDVKSAKNNKYKYGYVTFKNIESAKLAVAALNDATLHRRNIFVSFNNFAHFKSLIASMANEDCHFCL